MTHKSATSASSTAEVDTCQPPIRRAGSGWRINGVTGAVDPVRTGIIVTSLPPSARAPHHGPTPVASHKSSAPGGRSGGGSCELRHREEVAVEDAEPERAEEPAEDPEADDHCRLRPASELEMVMDRRHAEDTAVEDAEADDLEDHRERLHDEEAADDQQQQVQVQEQAQCRQAGTDGQ